MIVDTLWYLAYLVPLNFVCMFSLSIFIKQSESIGQQDKPYLKACMF